MQQTVGASLGLIMVLLLVVGSNNCVSKKTQEALLQHVPPVVSTRCAAALAS